MKIDAALVLRTARLASLELGEGEAEEVAEQLTRLVTHFEELRAIPESEFGPGGDPPPTPLREDVPQPWDVPIAEGNAPEFSHGHFVVPRVVHRPE